MTTSEAQLSQDEIDALLDGVAPESDDPPAWKVPAPSQPRGLPDGAGAVAGSFDAASAGRFRHGDLPTLTLINERFVDLFGHALHAFTGRRATVRAEPPTIVGYAAFVATLSTPSSLHIVRLCPSCGNGLFVFDAGLLYFVIDSLFGGTGSLSATKTGRHFTTTEHRLIGRLADLVFAQYTKAWAAVHPMAFEPVRSESEGRFVNLTAPDDAVLAFGFTIESGRSRGRFQVCLPLAAIDPIRDVLVREIREPAIAQDARWSERLAAQVAAAEVELVAKLASVPVTCNELLAMKVGDVIVLDIKPTIVVSADGIPVLRCRYGNADGRYAIRVEEVIVPSSGG